LFEPSEMDPYSIFIFVMNSALTSEKYTRRLAYFFKFIELTEGTMKERCSDFAERGKMISNGP
jgi:hypothetical protein